MATPTYAEVLTQINTYIVANGNNEITANVLNPVLSFILDFANNNIGDLSTLTTDETNSIVEAINSLKINFDDLLNNGVQLYTGYSDPNITPPLTYKYADFYMQLDSGDDSPVYLWQYNGIEWTTNMIVPIDSGTQDFPLLAIPTTTFTLVPGRKPKKVYVNQARWFILSANNTTKNYTYTVVDNVVTLKSPGAPTGALVSIDYE